MECGGGRIVRAYRGIDEDVAMSAACSSCLPSGACNLGRCSLRVGYCVFQVFVDIYCIRGNVRVRGGVN